MKIDLNYKFQTMAGKDMKEGASDLTMDQLLSIKTWEEFEDLKSGLKKGKVFTLRSACVNVLLMTEMGPNGRPMELKGEEKVERFQLATSIHKSNGQVDLKSEEISLLKKLIGRAYGPLTVGQAWKVLDPHEDADKKKKNKDN